MFSKCHFFIIKLKRNFFAFLFLFFLFFLLIFSKTSLIAAKNALTLWATSVVPSLFPFFVATELLMNTGFVFSLGRLFNNFMKPLFNINGNGFFCFFIGLISGYPMGAKTACNFRENNICSKEECERLLSFTNNSGPIFIVGTVGIGMFGNSTIGLLLLITHLLSSITVGFVFRFWKYNSNTYSPLSNKSENTNSFYNVSFSNLGEVLAKSISNSISTILMIGGFIVIFSSIISILKSCGVLHAFSLLLVPIFNFLNIDTSFVSSLIIGFLEITNGINAISGIHIKNISLNIIITSFILGFGGLSVLLQVWSIVQKSDLSIKAYFYGKLLQAVLSSFYTFLLINTFPIFNFNI